MYDGSGCGVKFRKFAGVGLAWWHSYKWCTKYIMKVFANDFIVPFIHYMFPTRTVKLESMDHTNHVAYLTYIRLSYPRWKQELAEALAIPTLTVRQKTLLTNMQDLCEYFIPVVCLNELVCSMNTDPKMVGLMTTKTKKHKSISCSPNRFMFFGGGWYEYTHMHYDTTLNLLILILVSPPTSSTNRCRTIT
jgi:hypothetical protein